MKKTQNFSYFSNSENDPKKKRNDFLKKFWKIAKIFLYLFAFSVTLTGCVQSFVLRTSSNVGNSIEFYRQKDDVAPRLNTFKPKAITNNVNYTDSNGEVVKDKNISLTFDLLQQDNDVNILVDNKTTLSKLKEQTTTNKGEYAKHSVFMTSIAAENVKDEKLAALGYSKVDNESNIIQKDGKILFRSESEIRYQYLHDPKLAENQILIFSYLPDQNRQYIALKQKEQKSTNSSGAEVTKRFNDVDENGKLSVSFISGLQKIDYVKQSDLEAITEAKTETRSLVNRAFARDVLQMFYAYTFGKDSVLLKRLNIIAQQEYNKTFNSFNDYYRFLVSRIQNKQTALQNNNEELFKITQEEHAIITSYHEVIYSWLNQFGIVPTRTTGNTYKTQISDSIMTQSNKYDENSYSIEDFILAYNKNTPKNEAKFYTNILLGGDYAVQPIYTWGQAWTYGPFYGLLVYPLSVMVQSLRQAMPDMDGWSSILAILIAVIFTRLLVLAFTFRSTMMQSVQEGLRNKKAAIEAKYIGFENNKSMKMKKSQELQALYSKYNINTLDQFANILLSMPIFLAMWRVIQGIPELKETFWLGINFSSVSWQKVMSGSFIYLWILIAAILVQLVSQLIPQWLNRKKNNISMTITEKQALKKSEKTQRIMMFIFTGITVLFSAGVQVYWLFGGLWQIGQALTLHKVKQTKWFKQKYSKKMAKK